MRMIHLGAMTIVAALCACSSTPTGLESPKHPYDFRGYVGSDPASAAMKLKLDALEAERALCYEKPDEKCRNKVVGELKEYIDDYWRRFKSDFAGRAGATNVAFDGTIATLTAAAPITSPTSAQNILTALATSLLAFRASAQKNLLGDQTAYALLGQMDSDRLVIGQRIANGLDSPHDKYTFARAMSDLAEYSSSMSVSSAVISMSRAGGANAQKVKDQETEEIIQNSRARAARAAALAAKSEATAANERLEAARAAASQAAIVKTK